MSKKRKNKILPYFLQIKFINFFLFLNNLENLFLNKKLKKINYKKIIVCGYPRSGTSLISSLINLNLNVSSYEYRDLPFILCVFCAHLGGETGLLKQFKDAGFRLNPLQALD